MKIVQICYTRLDKKLPDFLFEEYLGLLPFPLREKNKRYLRLQDRYAHLFGKLMLLEGLKAYGFPNQVLSELQYNAYSRPYIEGNIEFNISHSGSYVICAMGKEIKLGVDIEEIKDIDFCDFEKVMTEDQWKNIYQSADPNRTFYSFWTIKESVIKGDSRGLSIPLLDIRVEDGTVEYEGQKWYLKELEIDERYCSHIAINSPDVNMEIKELDYFNYEYSEGTFSDTINQI
jgi:4'-phosphopantetheinyl transferase